MPFDLDAENEIISFSEDVQPEQQIEVIDDTIAV